MSRREAKIIAVAGALQPKGLDLTQFRQRSLAERRLTLRSDDAAGALAFGASTVTVTYADETKEAVPGDPLPGLLIKLKAAKVPTVGLFAQAVGIVVHRYGGLATKEAACATSRAVAAGALFEWMNDACTACREKRPRRKMAPCLDCGQEKSDNGAILGQPNKWCQKCHGMGRIFEREVRSKGMLCGECGNTGQIKFKHGQRWGFVSEYLKLIQRAAGQEPIGVTLKVFAHWMPRYYRILQALQAIERRNDMAVGIDLGHVVSTERAIRDFTSKETSDSMRSIEPELKQEKDHTMAEPEAGSPTAGDEPKSSGELPPQES